jgi:hypothetical protein
LWCLYVHIIHNIPIPHGDATDKVRPKKRLRNATEILEQECLEDDSTLETLKKQYSQALDFYILEIGRRFNIEKLKPIVDIYDLICDDELRVKDFKESLQNYTKFLNLDMLDKELTMWYTFKKLKKMKNFDSIIDVLKDSAYGGTFPQIRLLVRIYLTLPITSASCERAFSALKRIKTYLRTKLGENRLNSLAIINIEKDNLEECIDDFVGKKKRRVIFILMQLYPLIKFI